MAGIDDPSLPLQAAIVAVLKASGSSAGARVYDAVPPEQKRLTDTGAAWPYISLGNVQVINEKIECVQGAEVYVTIDAWSRAVGKVELKTLGKKIITALDDVDLSGSGLSVNSCLLEDVNYIPDPDGLTSHGIFTFHILTN
ncbi:DUF3168 domain-containing protein [Tardiphaga sp. 37S4]|uniref:DUF3168 domain-containing protein n=1 Tax=Tardiphaga sp. 37S4 TaxID=1404741 RepID=UPI001E428EB1|nr:DUF3168 domain-containing protein [Tardiphaga sp. 37S4]UFS77221.1 DUF3168 domain-containing protein [Tardiphaga sp. 37S4]